MASIKFTSMSGAVGSENAQSSIAMTGLPAALFGVAFMAAGGAVIARVLVGGNGAAPPPLIIGLSIGAVFVLTGSFAASNGLRDIRRAGNLAEQAAAMPTEPWAWDYAWRPEGIGNDTKRQIAKSLGFALFVAIFLTPFHWIGFFAPKAPRIFGIFALLFDLVVVGMLVRAVRLMLMRERYGASWLRFGHFPFHTGEPLDVTLDGYGGLSALPRLTGELQCVQERYEMRGTGRNRSRQVVCYTLWSATTTADRNRDGGFAFHFDVPADAESSALSERPARFWQLVVTSDDVPGVDYKASFLVPVYARRR